MKVTGYQLREAIQTWKLRKTTAEASFTDSLSKFEGETKEAPIAIVEQVLAAEMAIVRLQVAQTQYNLLVKVNVPGEGSLSLAEVIKVSGVIGRIEKVWAGTTARDPYGYGNSRVRDPSQLRAEATITPKEILAQTTALSKRAGAYRAAIGGGNTHEVEIESLDAALFE